MKPKNMILVATAALLLGACTSKEQREAQALLQRATQAYENQQYRLVKLQTDSIKELYPTEFEIRKQAIRLLQRTELAECHIGLHYVDSLLGVNRPLTEQLYKGLKLDKNPRYEDVGHYYAPRHRTEKNIGRSYVRPQTSERGNSSLIVFYRGRPIDAHTLHLAAPDGSYIDLQATLPTFVTKDALGQTERADFYTQYIDNAAGFLAAREGQSIKVTLIGDKGRVNIPFTKADAETLIQVSRLGSFIRTVMQLEKQQADLKRQIEFINNRMQNDSIRDTIIE